MADKHEKTAAEQLVEIRQQRRVLAQQQVEETAAEMARSGTLSEAAAQLLTGNLLLLEMTEAAFGKMVDHLRQAPILAARVEEVDRLALAKQIAALESDLTALQARNRTAEVKLANQLEGLRLQALSADTAAEKLAGISQRYPNMVGLPNVRL
jgi:hypothetical protein